MGSVFPFFYFIVWYDEFIQSSGSVSQFEFPNGIIIM